MPVATNAQGQALRLDENNQWVPTQLATNPKTNERMALDGDKWVSIAPSTPAEQPGIMDRIVASPIGRAVQSNVVSPLLNMNATLTNALTMGQLPGNIYDKAAQGEDAAYQGAIQRNQNTPGYAQARAQADQQVAQRGSGIGDQMLSGLNPSIAGLALPEKGQSWFDTSNAKADAQQAAQDAYRQRYPVRSFGAGLVGGLLMGSPKLADVPALAEAPKIPSITELKAAAKDAYQQVDNAGIQVSADAMNGMADKLADKIGPRLDPVLHPDATAAYNRVLQYATDGMKGDSAATFNDLDNLRRVVADASGAIKPADKFMARQILDHIDDFVGNLKPSDLDTSLQDQLRSDLVSATAQKGAVAKQIKTIENTSPGALAARGAAGANTRATYMGLQDQLPKIEAGRQAAKDAFQAETGLINAGPQETIDALNNARDLWSRASQAELIQKQIDKAGIKASANYSQSGMENALRQQFKSLALNDRAMARLSPQVRQAVRDVVAGGPVSNLLRAVGKFAPHGPVATAAGAGIGYALGGPTGGAGALAIPVIGEAARTGATAMTKAAAQRALDIAALGRSAPIQAGGPMLQLPQLTAASKIPFGMIANTPPLLLQGQRQRQ